MAELNLSQIENTLNDEFRDVSSRRKIVFWYDSKGDFVEDVSSLVLENAKLLILKENHLFETKHILEVEDKESNYLVYAPFPRPRNEDNHLADTILYSKTFVADRLSLIMVELGIKEERKILLEKYSKFFNSKERFNKFKELEIDSYTEENIELGFLAILVGIKEVRFESIVKSILKEGNLEENSILKDFGKYSLKEAFWKYSYKYFGYNSKEPTLVKFVLGLFATYIQRKTGLENILKNEEYILEKPGGVIAFINSLMNDIRMQETFRSLSKYVYEQIDGDSLFSKIDLEVLLDLDVFESLEYKFINWIVNRFLDEHFDTKVKEYNIVDLINLRKEKFFGKDFSNDYEMLLAAYKVLSFENRNYDLELNEMVKEYDKSWYLQDLNYRRFYFHLDKIENVSQYEKLRDYVENTYVNNFLDPYNIAFNNVFNYGDLDNIKLQKDFYNNNIHFDNRRSLVIISDALRYEVGKDLVSQMNLSEKFEAEIEPQISILPSITKLGMAALLPHKEIEINKKFDVFVDEKKAGSLTERENILKSRKENSRAIQFDVINNYSKEELREFVKDQSVIYIYHNQIDARGDELKTENEVFNACNEAIEEIINLIRKLSGHVSIHNYIVTSDHGFIYKRSVNSEAEKIDKFYKTDDIKNRRFIISENEYKIHGTKSISLGKVLNNNDKRYVIFPNSSNVFKLQGGGQNYFHGGASMQEVITPLINIKTRRGAVETKDVSIEMLNNSKNITSLNTSLEIYQKDIVTDIIKAVNYSIYFEDSLGEIISNEELYFADSRDENTGNRIRKLFFRLKEKSYDPNGKYYIVIKNTKTGIEDKLMVKIDIPFADDFGFDV
ncbi:BREX-1 system phosphatase PglZ type A [Miniphocaeibacter halophilus]|uniref:BREX-1 system phosphatase PglZ type A n=1 Tax=Miniphocaeibacter halophilus TaxID=2931922 RepID=A0AC61MMX3_9FIRM|nr:BREX-1 system phosphatase PglZ type A [Miniphocaeibacter halophilus]QQK06966.1 BREX-1 system phosphatase PglZ type A [Miniphocaeibacter halophilus]